jgi:1-acyl-sn-glycerol-3-phosphate acyltransferase
LTNFMVRLLFGIEKHGEENIPKKGGALITCNHVYVYDPPLIGCACSRELYYLAKTELFRNSLFAWLIKKLNAIPISRGTFDRRGFDSALEILKSGKVLVAFPEGTRSKDGELKEFKLGAAKLALEAEVPIVPAYLDYSRNWLKAFLQRKKIIIKFGSPLNSDSFSLIPKNKEGYKRVTQEIMQKIRALKENS